MSMAWLRRNKETSSRSDSLSHKCDRGNIKLLVVEGSLVWGCFSHRYLYSSEPPASQYKCFVSVMWREIHWKWKTPKPSYSNQSIRKMLTTKVKYLCLFSAAVLWQHEQLVQTIRTDALIYIQPSFSPFPANWKAASIIWMIITQQKERWSVSWLHSLLFWLFLIL